MSDYVGLEASIILTSTIVPSHLPPKMYAQRFLRPVFSRPFHPQLQKSTVVVHAHNMRSLQYRTLKFAISHPVLRPPYSPCRVKNIVDDATTDDIRTALLAATSSHANVNSNKITETRTKIANFAMTHNPAITCASPDTVGGHGRDTCVTACQHTHVVPAWTPRKASCYVLCTLATAPCDTE